MDERSNIFLYRNYVDESRVVDVHVLVNVDGLWRIRLRSGPFEGPAAAKPPALPEETY